MKNFNWTRLIPYVLIVGLCIVVYFMYNKVTTLGKDIESKDKLISAIVDTMTTYKNERNELVVEKSTLQFELNDKTFKNMELTKRIKETEKKYATESKKAEVFAAAYIKTKISLDSLLNIYGQSYVSPGDSSITFSGKNEYMSYQLKAENVFASKYVVPKLKFEKFTLDNSQFIEFHWKSEPRNRIRSRSVSG